MEISLFCKIFEACERERALLTKNIWAKELKYDPGAVTKNISSPPLFVPISCFEHLFYAKPKATSPGCNKIQFTWKNERLIFIPGNNPIRAKDKAFKTQVEPVTIKIKKTF